jgi:hypothetical protein
VPDRQQVLVGIRGFSDHAAVFGVLMTVSRVFGVSMTAAMLRGFSDEDSGFQ